MTIEYIGSEDVLRILGIRKPTLYAWVRRGKLIPYRVGRLLKFREEEVRNMISASFAVEAWVVDRNSAHDVRTVIARTHPQMKFVDRQPPEPKRRHVWVQGWDGSRWVDASANPGAPAYETLRRIQCGEAYLFLGSEDPWTVTGLVGMQGRLTAWIERSDIVLPAREDDAVRRLESGILTGTIEPWTREEIHRRR